MQAQADSAPKARFSKLAVVGLLLLPLWIWLYCLLIHLMVYMDWQKGGHPDWIPFAGLFVTLLGVPAVLGSIVMGHIAARRIKRSDGLLRGKELAGSACILGYLALIGLFFLFFA